MADKISDAALEARKVDLEERRLALEERRVDSENNFRKLELEIKAREVSWTSKIFSPLTTTLLAGILALAASALGAFLQGGQTLLLEREKFDATKILEKQKFEANNILEKQKQQHELILKMISVGDEKQARANIVFLAENGLLVDDALAKRLLASKTQGVLPTSGAPLVLPIIIPGCEPLSLNFNDPIAQEKWLVENVQVVSVLQLSKIPGGPRDGSVRFNNRAAEALKKAWAEIDDKNLLDRVLSWDGAFVQLASNSIAINSHNCGLAFDINSLDNPRGRTPAPLGSRGSVLELVPILEKHGFRWGGSFRVVDGMHFEYVASENR